MINIKRSILKIYFHISILALVVIVLLTSCSSLSPFTKDTKFTNVTIHHYYTGPQQKALNELVEQYNKTHGLNNYVCVTAKSYSNVDALVSSLWDSVNKEVGSDDPPSIIATYADTAFEMNSKDLLADISPYFTSYEYHQYVDGFLREGKFNNNDDLKILPTAKSTEILALNKTMWDEFSTATNADIKNLETWEGIVLIAKKYYDWTDSQTETLDDGKAFFGRDAFANYMLVGANQLGHDIVTVDNGKPTLNIDADTMRKLWDNYYIPMVNGWFLESGRFRSDDLKTGKIISLVCSTSGSAYLPTEVTDNNGKTTPISCQILTVPNFQNTPPTAVQQGAGMVVLKSDAKTEKASVDFIKWFTQPEINIQFSVSSGYLPVTKKATSKDYIKKYITTNNLAINNLIIDSIYIASDIVENSTLYTSQPFDKGYNLRKIINTSMVNAVNEDLIKIDELVKNGQSRLEACNQIATDKRFEEWLKSFEKELNGILNI